MTKPMWSRLIQKAALSTVLLWANATLGESIQHEIKGRLGIDTDRGKVGSSESETKFGSSKLDFEIGYGHFVNDNVEPYIEFETYSKNEKLAKLSAESSGMAAGFGMLFNLPVAGDEPKESKKSGGPKKGDDDSKLATASFIPYAGLILSYLRSDDKIKEEDQATASKRSQSDLISKLKIGFRYTLFPHIALNSSLKVSIQNSTRDSAEAETPPPTKPKGLTQKITFEAELLSLSLLF